MKPISIAHPPVAGEQGETREPRALPVGIYMLMEKKNQRKETIKMRFHFSFYGP